MPAELLARRQAEMRARPKPKPKPRRRKTRAELAELARLRYAERRAEVEERRLLAQTLRDNARLDEQERRRAAAAEARASALREWSQARLQAPRLVSRPGVPHEPPYSPVEAEARRIHLEMHMPALLARLTGQGISEVVAYEVLTQVALDILEGRAYVWDAELDVVRARRSLAGDRPYQEAFQYAEYRNRDDE